MDIIKLYVKQFANESISDRIDSTARTAADTLHAIHAIQNQSLVNAEIENPEQRSTDSELSTPSGNSVSIKRTPAKSGHNPNYKKVVQKLKELHPELVEEIEKLEKEISQPFTRKAREIASVSNSDGMTARYSRIDE